MPDELLGAGLLVRNARKAVRMPQGQLADAVGISQKELCLREQGKRPITSWKELSDIRGALTLWKNRISHEGEEALILIYEGINWPEPYNIIYNMIKLCASLSAPPSFHGPSE